MNKARRSAPAVQSHTIQRIEEPRPDTLHENSSTNDFAEQIKQAKSDFTRRTLSLPQSAHARRASELVLDKIEQMAAILNEDAVPHQSARGQVIALIRLANLIVLMIMVSLIGTGTTYYKSYDNQSKTVHIAVETWTNFPIDHVKDILGPNVTDSKLRVLHYQNQKMISKQWLPFMLNIVLLLESLTLLIMRIIDKPVGRIMVGFYAFTAVPVELLTFAVEMYYCRCPWVQHNLFTPVTTRANPSSNWGAQTAFDDLDDEDSSSCLVYAWAAASALSLASAALFIADGIAACFETQHSEVDGQQYHVTIQPDNGKKSMPELSAAV